jgi:hypothetical protein
MTTTAPAGLILMSAVAGVVIYPRDHRTSESVAWKHDETGGQEEPI